MMGLVLALLASFCFAVSYVFLRRGVYRSGESFSPVPIFAFLGTMLFAAPLFMSDKAGDLMSLSWLGVFSLAGAGVIHLVIGRMLAFASVRLIGANRTAPIVTCSNVIAAMLGIFFLGEPVTILLVVALLLIVGGVIVISTTGGSETGKLGMPKGSLPKGVSAALGAALCWGASPALIKIGLEEVNSPLLAVFVSYLASSLVAVGLLLHPENNKKLRRLDHNSLISITIAAVAATVAQLLRYMALDYSPVSMVAPLYGTSALFVFPLSFLINREIEAFDLRIITGGIAAVVGVSLMFWAA